MEFLKNNKKFFLYGVVPIIILFATIGIYSKVAKESVVDKGQAMDLTMPGALVDSTMGSKAELYDEAAKKKELEQDVYNSNSDAKVDFKLVPDDNSTNTSGSEQSLEIQAKIEEQKNKQSNLNTSMPKVSSDEYAENQKRLRQIDMQTMQVYQQQSQPKQEPVQKTNPLVQEKVINRSFNSVKVAEQTNTYEELNAKNSVTEETISAVVLRDTKVSSNTPIVIRLLDNTVVNGVDIPKNTVLNGVANLSGERITVSLQGSNIQGKSIRYSFNVYDSDGLPGIRVSGADNGQLAHNTYAQQIQTVSSGAAARLGIAGSIGSSLLNGVTQRGSKQKVSVAAGYKLVLKLND